MAHPFKPNLQGFDCDEIEFDFHLDLSVNKARKVFGNQYSQDTDWDYTAYQEYSVERNKHSCLIVAHNRTKKKIRGKHRFT